MPQIKVNRVYRSAAKVVAATCPSLYLRSNSRSNESGPVPAGVSGRTSQWNRRNYPGLPRALYSCRVSDGLVVNGS
ncbi:hypothetical protein RRG08_013134 [Elysia crispata]|uniref:Uncharacterized protein n=1 Tax=Elysia crispata TaxID=231223 RepID=A0AAE1A0M1_9GAST|nr:hypothetical protein RRG08_013134 [Elysia crispata]